MNELRTQILEASFLGKNEPDDQALINYLNLKLSLFNGSRAKFKEIIRQDCKILIKQNKDRISSIISSTNPQNEIKRVDFARCINDNLDIIIDYINNIQDDSDHSILENEKKTFECLFRNKDHAKKVKDIFENNGYTIKGEWIGLSKNKTELLAAYYVLKPLLKGTKDTPQAKIFYETFNFKGQISDRSLRTEPFNEDRNEFEKIFNPLLPKS